MKYHGLRLKPNQDLKKEITHFIDTAQIKAGIILTCIGSLSRASIRLADERITKKFEEKFEILSLAGTLSNHGCHLHILLSDSKGNVLGGHLLEDCMIYSTAEIIIGEIEEMEFKREYDSQTGFQELKIQFRPEQ